MKVFSAYWWLVVALLLLACDATAPTPPTEPARAYDLSFLKANPSPGSDRGMCDPGGRNDDPLVVPQVSMCFKHFFTALGVSGATIGLCFAEAGGETTVIKAIAKWSACGLGVVKTMDAWGNWLDRTGIDGYYDWSQRELSARMREAYYARIFAQKQKEQREAEQ